MITENQLKRAFNLQYELADYEGVIHPDVVKYIQYFNADFKSIEKIIFKENGDLIVHYVALEFNVGEDYEEYNSYSTLISKKYLLCEDKGKYLSNFKK